MTRKLEKIIADSSAELKELTREKDDADKDLLSFKQRLIDSIKSVAFVSNANLIEKLKKEIENIESSAQKGDIEALKRLIPSIQAIANEKINSLKQETDTIQIFQNLFNDIINEMPSNLESKIAKDCSKIPLNYINVIRENIARAESSSVKQDIENIKKLKIRLNQIKAQIDELNADEGAKIKQDEIKDEITKCEEKEKEIKPKLESNKKALEQLNFEMLNLQKEIESLEQNIDTERIEHKLYLLDILCESMNIYKDKLISKLRD